MEASVMYFRSVEKQPRLLLAHYTSVGHEERRRERKEQGPVILSFLKRHAQMIRRTCLLIRNLILRCNSRSSHCVP